MLESKLTDAIISEKSPDQWLSWNTKRSRPINEEAEDEQQLRILSGEVGALKSQIEHYDETEESFNKEFDVGIRRNILEFYEDGLLEIRKKEMAKKTNTQLICLSGLGGDSIYNHFDNIYVVKLLESSIRNGVQRVEATHMKGEEVKRLVLSDFKMEQVSLFDFMEE